jgi:hypothetical protein
MIIIIHSDSYVKASLRNSDESDEKLFTFSAPHDLNKLC